MKRDLLLAEVARTPWAIEPTYGERVLTVLQRWGRGEPAADSDLQTARAAREERAHRHARNGSGGSIAVLPLFGVIVPRANLITEFSGGTSCQVFTSLLREAVADPSVGQIVIDIDSPGGSVHGVPELASEIMQARTAKPVIGSVNHTAASAAYWLGSCCSELYVSPSGEAGSIGVWQIHDDTSEALRQQGVKRTLISAGKYKVEGNSFEPLSDEARQYVQSQVNEFYRSFVAAVARGRGVSVERVRSGFGQGRMLLADAAKAEGMVDGIMDFDSLVRDLQARPRNARKASATASASGRPLSAAARQREIEILTLT
jgi:signal peptide peptidase SppA